MNPVLVNLNKKTIEEEISNFVQKSWVNLLEKESNMVTPQIRSLLKVPYRSFNRLKHRQIRQFDNKNNTQPWVNPFGRIQHGHPQNWTCQKRVFPVSFALFNFVKHLFRLWPKPWVNPFGKMSIFSTVWTSCFYILERRYFVLEYRKTHFLAYIAPQEDGKNGQLLTKTMDKHPWKIVNFSTFWTPCFYNLERLFFVSEYSKKNFPGLYSLKKTLKNYQLLT